jgi:hypothetical protein
MSRSRPLVFLSVLVALFAAACDEGEQQKKQKREAAYQYALQSYSETLKPGMTRREVENYFRAKGVAFSQICCIDERSALADLTIIGKEKHPWYCSAHIVYIAFQFAAVELQENSLPSSKDSDTLKKITVFHSLEGCL